VLSAKECGRISVLTSAFVPASGNIPERAAAIILFQVFELPVAGRTG